MSPEELEKWKKVFKFISTNEFGVVSTISLDGLAPESAVVAISETDSFELVFGSFFDSRKNQNIAKNPSVSVVIGWDNTNKTTIQFEGTALLAEGEERKFLAERHVAKNPDSKEFSDDPRQQYFRIVPKWVRYSNFSVDPQEVWELKRT